MLPCIDNNKFFCRPFYPITVNPSLFCNRFWMCFYESMTRAILLDEGIFIFPIHFFVDETSCHLQCKHSIFSTCKTVLLQVGWGRPI